MKNLKRTLVVLSTAALAAFAFVACKTVPAAPKFTVIENVRTFPAGQGGLNLEYRLEYMSEYSDGTVLQKIQAAQISDAFGSENMRTDPAESAVALGEATVRDYSSQADSLKWNGTLKINSTSGVLNGRIVTYTVLRTEDMGGAHGLETTKYSNYDLRTGAHLNLEDIFTPEGLAALPGAIRGGILKNHGKATWEELVAERCYFAAEEVTPTGNFLLSEGQIEFMYNPYDIACYAEGPTKVVLSLAGMTGFKKEILTNK